MVTSSEHELMQHIAARLVHLQGRYSGRSPIVACEGIDLSGKTTFSRNLAQELTTRGAKAVTVHQDDFLKSRAQRYRLGEWSPLGFYKDFWDFSALRELVLDPARSGRPVRYSQPKLDFHSDLVKRVVDIRINPEDILLVEGLFLLRPELERHFDFAITLRVDRDVALQRALLRDVPKLGPAPLVVRHYKEVVFPAHELYEIERCSTDYVDVVINNNDPRHPIMEKWSS
jgi:uridine kinase